MIGDEDDVVFDPTRADRMECGVRYAGATEHAVFY